MTNSTNSKQRNTRNATDKKLSKENINNELAQAMITISELRSEIDDLKIENARLVKINTDTANSAAIELGQLNDRLAQCNTELEEAISTIHSLQEQIDANQDNEELIALMSAAEKATNNANKAIEDTRAAMKRHRNISIGIVVTVAVVSIAIAIFK